MMRSVNDHTAVLIGKNINRTGSVQVLESTTSATYLADGELVVTDVDGTVLNSTTVVGKERIMIRQGRGATLPQIVAPIVTRRGVTAYKGANYTNRVQQVDYIGYNAATTSGAFEVINSNPYIITITNINSPNYGSTGLQRLGMYTSDATATHLEISDGLAMSLYQNTTRTQYESLFIVERVNSDAGSATTAATGTMTATNGSITVACAGGTPSTDFDVNDYVRFGTAVTSPVYKVTAIDDTANTITLDIPYQGTTGTFAAASAEFITAALALAGESGIRLTGKDQTFNEIARLEYMVSRWQTNMINGGTTPVVNQVIANTGVGVGNSVIELENSMLGNEGFLHRNTIPYVTPRKDAVSSATYSFVHLVFNDVDTVGILSVVPHPKEIVIATACTAGTPNTYGTAIQGAVTSVVDVLNAWIGTTPGPFVDVTLA